MFPNRTLLSAVPFLLLLAIATGSAIAQPLSPSMVESHLREWIAAWASNDPAKIVKVDPPIDGFGVRTLQARSDDTPEGTYLTIIKSFFTGLDYYRVELNQVQTKVDGNIGLAWGFCTERFKRKGHRPEVLRIRFTRTVKYDHGRWQTLLHHGDIQRFDEKGNYLPAF
jgi:ketosteroid isomerase-like protein